MGYSSITIQPGFHLFTATFEDVAGNEYKLNDIKILNEDGTEWDVKDTTSTACVIQKMTTDGKGKYDGNQIYNYRHYFSTIPPPSGIDRGLGWYVGSGANTRVTDAVTIDAGEAVSINNKTAVDIIVVFPSPIAQKETPAE